MLELLVFIITLLAVQFVFKVLEIILYILGIILIILIFKKLINKGEKND